MTIVSGKMTEEEFYYYHMELEYRRRMELEEEAIQHYEYLEDVSLCPLFHWRNTCKHITRELPF